MPVSPRKKNSFLSSPVTLVIIGVLTIYVLFQLFDVYSKKKYTYNLLTESKTYHSSVQRSLREIEERSALIEDVRGKEAYLREKEGLLLPGEKVYVIVDASKVEATSTPKVEESLLRKIVPFY